jgi:hypothetical protein
MQLIYGTYTFPANATLVTGQVRTLFNRGGLPYAQVRTVQVQGYLEGTGQAALIVAESALRTALASPYYALAFRADDGTITPLSLSNTGSTTGVRITEGPHFDTAQGPEYATLRTFRFSAEAEYPLTGAPAYLDFTETLTFSGGGPVYAHRPAINGPPQRQQVWPASVYRVTQAGSASGYRGYPPVPAARWPFALREAGQVSYASPERKGPAAWQDWRITWSYQHESASPLAGLPTLWNF